MALKDWRPFVYGGVASITAEFGTFPMDTTKTRLQIQGQQIDAKYTTIKYNGMVHALLRISREEGFTALYNGIAPAVLRQATYGTIKIGVYYTAKKYLMQNREDESLGINVICAVFAGVISASLANPTDVLKIRMQAQCEGFTHKSMPQCFTDIYRLEGVRGLWRGVGSTAQRAAIIVGIELPVYDVTKRHLMGSLGDTVGNHLLSSFIAGLAGAIGSSPIDVVRTRLMNQKNVVSGTQVNVYTGALDCALKTVKTEGFFALYKGFIPTWFRLGPWNIIFFVTYEQLKKLY